MHWSNTSWKKVLRMPAVLDASTRLGPCKARSFREDSAPLLTPGLVPPRFAPEHRVPGTGWRPGQPQLMRKDAIADKILADVHLQEPAVSPGVGLGPLNRRQLPPALASGITVKDGGTLQDRLAEVHQRVRHHPFPEVGGAARSLLGIVDREVTPSSPPAPDARAGARSSRPRQQGDSSPAARTHSVAWPSVPLLHFRILQDLR